MSQTKSRPPRFEGRVAIVTGAASGMGAAMVRGFHAEGATVVAVDIDREGVEATAAEVDGGGDRITPVALDVTDADAVAATVAEVAGRGRIDVLCNNAGILDDYVPAHEASWELWSRILAVNLSGPFLLARAVVPTMLAQGAGAIVNTCSIAAFVGGGGGAAYTTSKHGLLGLTRQLAFDYGRHGIRVNAICPGAVATGMTTELRTPEQANEHVDAAIAATPAGRWGEPEEVAALALFLASDEASFIHGTPVLVDGGWTLS
ncbi:short-chain dehydrogenase/reductase SDR [Patulibacter medicamentivorans]|uniref:Short-chain dehydrogenase/reductase SDR n=1 Tax=Patulibacter medicamentivorans TaxID=1097667 RepID=H0E6H2_9ACTN|nr:glucose 1-dehydrogenase [Patulibacter medicamentivorans]EHN10713.1 short-chain dehydrogenase/reductase SDR [Patulibacter medicamentivorans]